MRFAGTGTARRALLNFMLLLVLLGVVDAQFMEPGANEPMLLAAAQALALSYALFSWYCRDGNERGYVRSRWLSMAMVFGAIFAIPYYLVRSRARGKRGMALLKFAGLCVLAFVALLLGTVAGLVV
ncbi:MAG: hypothetical protein V4857_25060 [Pseudomonadota bacterium]